MFSNNTTRTLDPALSRLCATWECLLEGASPKEGISVLFAIKEDETVHFYVHFPKTNSRPWPRYMEIEVNCVADSPVAAINDCQRVLYEKLGGWCR